LANPLAFLMSTNARFILILVMLLCVTFARAQTRYWVADAAANWSGDNWANSSNGTPDGGGPPTASQHARFDANGNGNCTLDLAIDTITDFYVTSYTGTIEFDGNDLRATGTVTLSNGSLEDNSGGSDLVISSSGTATFNGASLNVRLDVDAAGIELDGSRFEAYVDLHKTSTGNSYGNGGNYFGDTVVLSHSGASGYLLTGGGNADTFSSFVSVNASSTGLCYLAYSGTGHNFRGDVELTSTGTASGCRIGAGGGESTMEAGNTIQVGSAGFSSGILEMREFTQLGSAALSLTATGTSTRISVYDASFGGNVSFSAPRLFTRGSTYSGTATLTKTGATNDASAGGNVFDDNAVVTNSGSGYLLFGNGTPDSFNLDLSWTNSGSYHSYLAYNSANNYIGGDLTITHSSSGTSSYFYISQTAASSLAIDGDVTASNSGSATDSRIIFADNGSATIGGNAVFTNASTGTTGNIQAANNTSSSLSVTGTARFINSGGGTTCNTYIGNVGDATFSDSLYILNSSTATNSRVYCNQASASTGVYNGDIYIENSNASSDGIFFGQSGGSGTLAAGQSMVIGSGGFQAGNLYLRNFTQLGSTAISWTLTNNATTTFYDAVFGGNVSVESPNINTRGTDFGGTLFMRKTGATNDNQAGGNTVAGAATLNSTGTGYWLWGNGSPDSFNTGLTINDSSSYNFYLAYNSADNYIDGDLVINRANTGTGSYMYVCDITGSGLTITGDASVTNTSSSSNSRLYFGDNGSLALQGDLDISENASGSTAYNYVGVQSTSSVTIGGDASVNHTNTGTLKYTYFGNSGDVDLTGRLTLLNSNGIDNSLMYVANASTSTVTVGGVAHVTNDGSGTTKRVFLGNSGDVTFSDSLIVLNSSDATNSQVYLNHASTSSNTYNGDILLESTDTSCDGVYFGNAQGEGTLAAGQTISFTSNGFEALYLQFRNWTQLGGTAQALSMTSGTGYMYHYNAEWQGNVDFESPRVYLYDSRFGGTATIEKNGASDDQSHGLNHFSGNTILNNTGTGYWLMGNGNPDSFLLDLEINNSSSDNFYLAYSGGANYVGGDLTATHSATGGNTYMYFSSTAATSLQVDGAFALSNTASSTGTYIYVGSAGDVTIGGDFDMSNLASSATSNMYAANSSTSQMSIGGHADLTNNGTGAASRIYFGHWGDITVSDSLIIENTAAGASSQVYCNLEDSSVALYQGDIVLESTTATTDGVSFGQNGGSATLASGQTISIGSGGFLAGALYFYRFNQVGSTAQTLNATGTTYMYHYDSDWDGNVDFSAPRFRTDFTRYDGTATLEKTGAIDDASAGGNYFANNAVLTNSGSRYLMMGNGNPDTFAMDLDFINSGTYTSYLAQASAGNYIGGDLTIDHTGTGSSSSIVIGNNNGSSLEIAGDVLFNSTPTATSSNSYFGNYTDITVGGDLTINHSASSNTAQLLVAYQVASSLSVGGVTRIDVSGSGTSSLSYIGYQGDITFSDSVYLLNSSSATSSELRVAYEDSSTVVFNGDIVVENDHANGDGVRFGQAGGNCSLADGQRIVVGPNGFISGGLYFYRFHQIGSTTQSLTTTGTSYIYNYRSEWEADVSLTGPRNRTDDSDFGGDAYIEKTGSTDDQSSGGSTVAGDLTLVNSGTDYLMWGNSAADSVLGDLTMTVTGSEGIYYAQNQPNHYVGGNVTGSITGAGANTWVYLSSGSSSSLQIDGDVSLSNTSTGTTSQLLIGNAGDVTIGGDVDLLSNSSSTNAYGYIANGSASTVDIGGRLRVENGGAGTTHRVYVGNNGDVSVADSSYFINTSSAANSQMYCASGSTSSCAWGGDMVVESSNASCDGVYFSSSTGSSTLAAGQTVTVSGNGFIAGTLYFRNFTQVGATPQTITTTGTSTLNNYSSDWGGNVTFTSPRFYTYDTDYRGTAYFEKTGSGNDASAGSNTVAGNAELVNSGSGYFLMGNGPADSLMANATFSNEGTNSMYFAYANAGHYIGGDLDVSQTTTGVNTYFYLSSNTGSTLQVDGDATLSNTSSASNSRFYVASAGSVDFNADFDYINAATGTNSYSYLANSSVASVSIDGVASFTNATTGSTTHYTYIGNSGDISFGDSLYVINNSSANNNAMYLNYSSASSNSYDGHIVLESYNASSDGIYFGSSTGAGALSTGNTVSIGPSGFTSGTLYFRNFTQQGATPQALSLGGTTTVLNMYDSEWNGDLNFDAPRTYTSYTTYNGDLDLEKTGASSDASTGGNTYNGDVIFRNSGTGYQMIPNSVADDFNGDLTLVKTSTGLMYPSYSATSTYAGDINLNSNTAIVFGANTGRIEFDGTAAQSVNDLGSSPMPNFRRININNSADSVTLNMPVEVQTDITFTDGILVTDSVNLIQLRDNATATGASDASFVQGYLEKIGNDAFEFPVGDSLFRPIAISAPSGASSRFRATYQYTNPAPTYTYGNWSAPIDHVSTREYWLLDRTNGSSSVNVTLSWDVNSGGVTDLSELLIARWDGSSWVSHGNGGTTGNTTAGTIVSASPLTSFSPFTMASSTPNNPLPIDLIDFKADAREKHVDLTWRTANEINNDYFTLERSQDGLSFEELAEIDGAGNSNIELSYSYQDKNPYYGVSYYRLKQTDFDGSVSYSSVERVEFETSGAFVAWQSGSQIFVRADQEIVHSPFQVYNGIGQLVFDSSIHLVEGEQFSFSRSKLGATGVYHIRLGDGSSGRHQSIFVH